MSNLLHVTRLKSDAVKRGFKPLMIEYAVSPETAPFLVSSSTSVMWIHDTHPGSIVKAAVREMRLGSFFREIIEAVTVTGLKMEWGNIHPLTVKGLIQAVDHLKSYEFIDLDLLIPLQRVMQDPDESDGDGGSTETESGTVIPERLNQRFKAILETFELPVRPSSWVPKDCVVVVPRDRTFVGVATMVTGKKVAGVVHNAARGIAIARGFDELADDAHQKLSPE